MAAHNDGTPRENMLGGLAAFGVGLLFLIIVATAAHFLARMFVHH